VQYLQDAIPGHRTLRGGLFNYTPCIISFYVMSI
jgi:hypothetical protein